jgi:hypothetical protein
MTEPVVLGHTTANAIWDILEAICDAPQVGREAFVTHVTQTGLTEYRFGGSLGSGGKVWNHWFRVTCYREDDTPERRKAMERANERLGKLYRKWVDKHVVPKGFGKLMDRRAELILKPERTAEEQEELDRLQAIQRRVRVSLCPPDMMTPTEKEFITRLADKTMPFDEAQAEYEQKKGKDDVCDWQLRDRPVS